MLGRPLVEVVPASAARGHGILLYVSSLAKVRGDAHAVGEWPFENFEIGEPQRQIGWREAEKPEGRIKRKRIASRPQLNLLKPGLHDFRQCALMMTAQDERILGQAVLRRISK